MNISVLASGSKGNCTYIETNNMKILIDLGTSARYVEESLNKIGVDPKEIDAIFLTHTHTDHISGLRVFLKKYKTQVYLTEIMKSELDKLVVIPNYEYIETEINIKDLNITPVKTSHDTEDSQGYVFENEKHSIAHITDTGYINFKNYEYLRNKEIYIIESNHDIELLMNGKYPYYLKQRILGDSGHLSNNQCAEYLSKLIGDKTRHVILIHLSEDNNTEEIAYNTLNEMLEEQGITLETITISKQNENTELVRL